MAKYMDGKIFTGFYTHTHIYIYIYTHIYIYIHIWPKVKEVKKWQDVFWEYLLGSIHNRHWLNMIPIIDVHYYPSSTVQWSRGYPCGNQPQNQFWWYHHFNLTKENIVTDTHLERHLENAFLFLCLFLCLEQPWTLTVRTRKIDHLEHPMMIYWHNYIYMCTKVIN